MKNLLTASKLLFILLVMSQCSTDDNQPLALKSGNLGTSVFLKEDEGVYYKENDQEIEVHVTQIDDSRCPQDVVCIWGGQVTVTFVLPPGETTTLCLGSDGDCVSSVEFIYNSNTYQLILLDVNPYPTTTNREEKKVVEFTLVKVS